MVVIIALTLGGLFASARDALQLERILNLNLTETLILTQGIVNLQREVLLTHQEVLRLLGNLDSLPEPVTRYDFVDIQITNLAKQVDAPTTKLVLEAEDLALVEDLESESASVKQLIADWHHAGTPQAKTTALKALDTQLRVMEAKVKQLIDRQATAQREAIIQTRDSLGAALGTSFLTGGTLLLMGIFLAILVRRGLHSRLQRAEESERLKSQLVASVSHELRTPLNAIRGYSELLDEDAYGALTTGQRSTVQRILLNAAQLQGMVNNLLDQAQIEQGKLSLRNTSFAPADLIQTSQSALSILAKTKGLELKSEIAADVPETLIGDVLRLQQILFNLTSNALKFTESGSVSTRVFLPDPDHWALQVVDTGIGIPAESQARVFESFWQIDSTATRQYRGSGLGLSIVKQLADLMGGKITLTSQLGQGSTFTVIFPIVSEVEPEHE